MLFRTVPLGMLALTERIIVTVEELPAGIFGKTNTLLPEEGAGMDETKFVPAGYASTTVTLSAPLSPLLKIVIE